MPVATIRAAQILSKGDVASPPQPYGKKRDPQTFCGSRFLRRGSRKNAAAPVSVFKSSGGRLFAGVLPL